MKNLGILLLLIVISFASCSKPDEYYKDLLIYSDRNYPGKLQNLKGSNGYYRLKIKYDIPPNNSVSKIVLKGATDSLVFDVPEGKSGTKDSLIVKDLMETNYRYQIYTLNKDNVKSIKRELSFKIYGDRYKSSLTTLNVRSKATVNTNDLRLIFNGDRANVLAKSKFEYTDRANKLVKLDFKNPTDTIVLPNYKTGTDVYLSNGFIPTSNSIDTLYTTKKKLILP